MDQRIRRLITMSAVALTCLVLVTAPRASAAARPVAGGLHRARRRTWSSRCISRALAPRTGGAGPGAARDVAARHAEGLRGRCQLHAGRHARLPHPRDGAGAAARRRPPVRRRAACPAVRERQRGVGSGRAQPAAARARGGGPPPAAGAAPAPPPPHRHRLHPDRRSPSRRPRPSACSRSPPFRRAS